MTRLLLVTGSACLAMGTAWLLPILFEISLGEPLSEIGRKVAWLGPAMLASGMVLISWGFCRPKPANLPGPVRMAITVDVLFLSFCSLEFSDGLVRQEGRLLYWTTYLFPPALLLLIGLTLAKSWAWWCARGLAATFALGCFGVALAIPFGDVRAKGEPVSALGRAWMIAVTLVFIGTALLAFRALGHTESRHHFGLSRTSDPQCPP